MGYLLILGANTETAKALAKIYALHGCDLYLADKAPELLEDTRQILIEEHGVDVQLIKFDVTEFYNHRNLFNSLAPRPFGVICAVDYQGDQLRSQKDFLEAKRIVDINYTGLISMLNIIANNFEEKESGFITAISSSSEKINESTNYIYNSAKAGFNAYIAGLRARLSGSGVTVLTVMQPLVVNEPEKYAEEIFNAQQKGKDVLQSKETGNLASLVKGFKWK